MATISEISRHQFENIPEGHSVDINNESFHDSPNSTHSLSPGKRRVLVAIILSEFFLAPRLPPLATTTSYQSYFEHWNESLGNFGYDQKRALAFRMLYTHVLILLVDSSDIFNHSSSMDFDNPGLWTRS
ncbi:uncharacterized protein EAF01_005846 [Botrytis porri]|uniref:uncharacterized protein n=1 Tax=Botrytis porri TaxID=87229 RepID=UPI0018FFC9A9|nr:uncharacterized protein EAF01_005846 [Botrytis porri]KAF7905325.1 hypothetical protein EAF01_005846 [Botrytis porri]